ncbi:MAG: hypothetical protein IPL46_12335 [Saprospiraceae bacterium]|nr:hypothetical protein [Saprospiraceae bacterium]
MNGFYCPEIDQALDKHSDLHLGMIKQGSDQMLTVRHTDLMAPMIKAMQEMKTENDLLKSKVSELEKQINNLFTEVSKLHLPELAKP